MRAHLLLCDFAQVNTNKLTVVGAGWDTLSGPGPMGLGVIVEVDWDETNVPSEARIDLVNGDGHPFTVPTPDGPQPIEVQNQFEMGRPAGTDKGSALTLTFAVNVAPLPFVAAGRYTWRLFLNGETRQEWQRSFRVTEAALVDLGGDGV